MRTKFIIVAVCACLLAFTVAEASEAPLLNDLTQGQTGEMRFPSITANGPTELVRRSIDFEKRKIPVWGNLLLPNGDGPFPAMVISHGSSGLAKQSFEWGEFYAKIGVAAFVIDHFTPRGVKQTYTDQENFSEWALAVDDVFALKLLSSHPKIDAKRIGVTGFSKGGNAALFAAYSAVQDAIVGSTLRFALHLPFYPYCNSHYTGLKFAKAETILFIGERDDMTPLNECVGWSQYINEHGGNSRIVSYANSFHGFDTPGTAHEVTGKQNYGACKKEYHVPTQTMRRRDTGEILDPKGGVTAYNKTCMTSKTVQGGNAAARAKVFEDVRKIIEKSL